MSESFDDRPATRHAVADAELVGRAQGGDRGAFAELYTRHAPAVARLARARTGASDVDDAVAETFVRAWSSLGRYRDTGSPFVAWLFGIGRNVIADGHRKAARTRPDADPVSHVEGEDDRRVEVMADLVDLGRAMRHLNRRQRTVIELKYLAGLDNTAVGEALGIEPGAVNTLQWRALRKLQSLMEVPT